MNSDDELTQWADEELAERERQRQLERRMKRKGKLKEPEVVR